MACQPEEQARGSERDGSPAELAGEPVAAGAGNDGSVGVDHGGGVAADEPGEGGKRIVGVEREAGGRGDEREGDGLTEGIGVDAVHQALQHQHLGADADPDQRRALLASAQPDVPGEVAGRRRGAPRRHRHQFPGGGMAAQPGARGVRPGDPLGLRVDHDNRSHLSRRSADLGVRAQTEEGFERLVHGKV